MKFSLIACIALFYVNSSNAQTQITADSMFVVTYTLGAAWDESKKPHEQLYFKEHSAHLSSLRKSGIIKFGARYADRGMIFLSAATLEKARELTTSDIAVKNGLFKAEVLRMNVFYPYKE